MLAAGPEGVYNRVALLCRRTQRLTMRLRFELSDAIPRDATGLGVAVGDLTGNGWPDVMIGGPNRMFVNLGGGRFREATFHSRPIWMVIQFVQGWSTDRWPTEEELRTMSLMAITEGARGLLYWSYGARALMWVKDPRQREEYWHRLVSVTRELRSLEPALVAADANESVTSVSDWRIRWLARVADGKCYVFAYLPAERFVENTSAAERTEVRFTLTDGQTVTRTFRPDFAQWFAVPFSPSHLR